MLTNISNVSRDCLNWKQNTIKGMEGSGRGRREEGSPGNELHLHAFLSYKSEQVVIDISMKV